MQKQFEAKRDKVVNQQNFNFNVYFCVSSLELFSKFTNII